MSLTFTKLFGSITESTIWVEPDQVRICWITMLAMADRKGRVFGSIPGLASRARISLESTEDSINRFLSPDKYSRTSEFEGRRIEKIKGGWRLLNYLAYREMQDEETVKETKRLWAQKNREKIRKEKVDAKVDNSRKSRPLSIQAEEEEDLIRRPTYSELKSKQRFLEVPPSPEMDEIVSKCEAEGFPGFKSNVKL